MKREHRPHKIRSVQDWNDLIPIGTCVVVNEGLVTETVSSAYAVRRCNTLVRVVRVGGRGTVPIEKVRIPSDLAPEWVDWRYSPLRA